MSRVAKVSPCTPSVALTAAAAYTPFAIGGAWGPAWGTTWFHLTGLVPEPTRPSGAVELRST